MSVPQISSERLKRLKERGFCRKVRPIQRPFFFAALKFVNKNLTLLILTPQLDNWKLQKKQIQAFELADGKCGIPESKEGCSGDIRDIHGVQK